MLIAIEGVDGAGKATQTKLLTDRLRADGKRVGTLSFPAYGTPGAVFVERYLHGELGDPASIDPYVAASFYSLDRFAARDHILRTVADHDVTISDRYAVSNFIHRGVPFAETGDLEGLSRFYAWLSEFEFDRAGIPRPDLVIFLSLGMGNIERLLEKKSREFRAHTNGLDLMERDLAHQAAALRIGREILPGYFAGYRIVECEDAAGTLLPPEAVAERVWRAVSEFEASR
jgi:dTMP kinase